MSNLYSCSKCKQQKPKEEFYKDKSRTTGIMSQCKACNNARPRPNRWQNSESYRNAIRRGTKKRDSKPEQRIKNNLRSRIRKIFKKQLGDVSAIRHLGCSYQEFVEHIQNLFQPGMTLENYGEWHIDHTKPLSTFDLTNPEEIKKASHYSNLQPLWAKDNLKKGNKIS